MPNNMLDSEHKLGEQEETKESFVRRVLQLTGQAYAGIERGSSNDLLGGHIFAKRGDEYVVGIGQPNVDQETGEETYSEFRIVDVSNERMIDSMEYTTDEAKIINRIIYIFDNQLRDLRDVNKWFGIEVSVDKLGISMKHILEHATARKCYLYIIKTELFFSSSGMRGDAQVKEKIARIIEKAKTHGITQDEIKSVIDIMPTRNGAWGGNIFDALVPDYMSFEEFYKIGLSECESFKDIEDFLRRQSLSLEDRRASKLINEKMRALLARK
jgi:hypothetical protein